MATMVSRPKFDAFLVEKAVAAGARIAEAEAFREMCICLVADDPLADESFGQNMREPVELRNGFIYQGHAWAFPKRDHVSFGIRGDGQRDRSAAGLRQTTPCAWHR